MKTEYMNKLIKYTVILLAAPLCSFAGWDDLKDSSEFPPEEGSPLAVLIAFGHASEVGDLEAMKALTTSSMKMRLEKDPNAVSSFKKMYGARDWDRPIFYEIEMNEDEDTAVMNIKLYHDGDDELGKWSGLRFRKIEGAWKLK